MTEHGRLGRIERHNEQTTLRYRRLLAHPPEKVWRALTESEHQRWWLPVDMIGEKSPGSTVRLVFWPDLVAAKGLDPEAGTAKIEVWDPPNGFEWVWSGSRIHFEIVETDDGCELHLTVDIESDDSDTIVDNASGYHLWMDHLPALLDTGTCTPIAEADAGPLEAKYRAVLNSR